MNSPAFFGYDKQCFIAQIKQVAMQYICVAGVMLCCLVSSVTAQGKPDKIKSTEVDLAYNTALYQLFQQKYFKSLSELLIAERQQKFSKSVDDAQLLRGGIYLSYGMDIEAERIFEKILKNTPVDKGDNNKSYNENSQYENQARAWFYLGKLLYKKGEFKQALLKFMQVPDSLTPSLHQEFSFLKESALLRTRGLRSSELGTNITFNPNIESSSIWFFYQQYNQQLSALHELCEPRLVHKPITEEIPVFEESTDTCSPRLLRKQKLSIAQNLQNISEQISLSNLIDNKNELLNLKEKIHIAAGYLYLDINHTGAAIKSFKQVRKNSLFVEQALLGYGWAAVNAGDYKNALAPWQLLASHSMQQPSTHEALLAVPFVYEKLGAFADALEQYDNASQRLDDEIKLLREVQDKLPLLAVETILTINNSNKVAWLDEQPIGFHKPENSMNIDAASGVSKVIKQRLRRLQSKQTFSLVRNQFIDLIWLQQQLEQWEQETAVVQFMLDEKKQRIAKAIKPEFKLRLQQRYNQLLKQKNALKTQVNLFSLNPNENLNGLMNAGEKKIYARIIHAKEKMLAIEQGENFIANNSAQLTILENLATKKEQVERLEGLLQWQVSQKSSERQWQYTKSLIVISDELLRAKRQLNDFDVALIQGQKQIQEKQNMLALEQRIVTQKEKVKDVYTKLSLSLNQLVNAELSQQINQLTVYLAQARLAKARLLDTLSLEGEPLLSLSHSGAKS